jgi:hypothetical protein
MMVRSSARCALPQRERAAAFLGSQYVVPALNLDWRIRGQPAAEAGDPPLQVSDLPTPVPDLIRGEVAGADLSLNSFYLNRTNQCTALPQF